MSRIKLILFDRDGVLNRKPPANEYVLSESELILFDKVFEKIATLSDTLNYACITNQQCVGKGLLSVEELLKINSVIKKKIYESGGKVMPFFICPHLQEMRCDCRKPAPGLIFEALEYFNVSREEAIFIGDSKSDQDAAISAGIEFRKSLTGDETVRILNEINRSI